MSFREGEQSDIARDQDRYLPIANIARIMKRSLPSNAKISREAKEVVQESVSEFISFVTSEASDKCFREKRKTINGDDLIWAIASLGFEEYLEPLKLYLQKYREAEVSYQKQGFPSSELLEGMKQIFDVCDSQAETSIFSNVMTIDTSF
mmetsp:Transcript_8363/g.16095  ORF Transcript_8363/g.16095 Transcript_8363/m.16095 type:complete len:149 (-) Transcript_8363:320-766(-)